MKTTMMQDERWLDLYKEYGYIPFDLGNESVTATLEYAYDDWCVAQMAKALGKKEDYQYFLKRSMAFQQLFDPETNFMRGKSKNGKWHEPLIPNFPNMRPIQITPKATPGSTVGLCRTRQTVWSSLWVEKGIFG